MLNNYIDYKNLIKFTQKLIQTPSESRKEEKIAHLIAKEMKKLNYDEIDIDEKFNVYGKINGKIGKPNLLFNGHIDHAEAGFMKNPFSGEILNGRCFGYNGEVIYGRGASDMKAGIAAMVYAVGASKKLKLNGNVLMTAVSLEEMGFGEGINYLFNKKKYMQILPLAERLRIPEYPDGNSEGIRTLNRNIRTSYRFNFY